MKHTFSFILFLMFSSVLLLNCDCKRQCHNPAPVVSFQNFDSVTLRTVIVNEYSNNGQFDNLETSRVYTSRIFTAANPAVGDTLELGNSEFSIAINCDYIISVPSENRTWRLRNISVQAKKMSATQCTNGYSYFLNDTLYNVPANSSSGNIPGFINILN